MRFDQVSWITSISGGDGLGQGFAGGVGILEFVVGGAGVLTLTLGRELCVVLGSIQTGPAGEKPLCQGERVALCEVGPNWERAGCHGEGAGGKGEG